MLTALGVVVLVLYIRQTDHFLLFLLLLCIIFLDIYLAWGEDLGRRKRAKKYASLGGEYRLEIQEEYVIYGEEDTKAGYDDTKLKARLFCSEKVYVLKMGRDILVLPKRVMNQEQKKKLEAIVRRKHVSITEIRIERRE